MYVCQKGKFNREGVCLFSPEVTWAVVVEDDKLYTEVGNEETARVRKEGILLLVTRECFVI